MILDTSSFNLAIAAIGESFGASASEVTTINLGYVVAVAVMIPLAGWMGERFGTVRIIIVCLSAMIIGSIIGSTADTLPAVVIARIAQGAGGGGLVPLAYSLMFRNFAPQNRLKIMAALALPISLAPALGPLIGGILVEQLSWRWVFLLNIPVSLIALLCVFFLATEATERAVRPLDIWGALLAFIGLGSSVFGVQQLANGADILLSTGALVIGMVALTILVAHERRKGADAFIDISLFRHRVFSKSTAITLAHAVGFMGFGLAGPLLLQTQLGTSAMQAGLVGAAGALGPIVSSRFTRPLIIRLGAKPVIAISQIGILIGLTIITGGYYFSSIPLMMVGMFLSGAASLLTIITCQNVGFGAIPPTNLGDATTLEGTGRQISNALGISVVTAMLALSTWSEASMLLTVVLTIGALALFHVFALVILFTPRPLPLPGAPATGH